MTGRHHFDSGNTAHLPNHVENEDVPVKYVTGAAQRAEGSGDVATSAQLGWRDEGKERALQAASRKAGRIIQQEELETKQQ